MVQEAGAKAGFIMTAVSKKGEITDPNGRTFDDVQKVVDEVAQLHRELRQKDSIDPEKIYARWNKSRVKRDAEGRPID